MFPGVIKNFLYDNNEKQGCYCLAVNSDQRIVQAFGNHKLLGIKPPTFNMEIIDFLPGILTESFDEGFEIPFYNITSDIVCNLYYLKYPKVSYLLLIDKSEIFNITQKYQQFAHDDNISKNKYKRLSNKLEKAQKKLKTSNQEKATLIAMLSHELGTPLTSILGYSELLLKSNDNCQKNVEIINRNANYLKHMIENTLMFGSSEAEGLETKIEAIQIKNLFGSLKNTILPSATHKNLRLIIDYSSDELINIDITRTKQILINLLNNAVKYTEKGSIELSFTKNLDKYIFSVKDSGLGIPENRQKDIFNPWKRIKENTEKGSGIGLFISQKLSEAIGASLKLQSSNAKDGSIFQLLIPIRESKDKENKVEIDIKVCEGKSILVIDDDDDILFLIEALLKTTRLKIYTSNNFPNAMDILKKQKIDTVLIDLNLGTIKATSCIEPIRKINSSTPILLMSAMPSKNIKNNYQSRGFNGVISKPLNSNTLLDTITRTLKQAKL